MEVNPKKIYVGNLPFSATNKTLTELFERFGDIEGAKIVTDRTNNKPKGFGFVTFADSASAEKAIAAMHNVVFQDRPLTVRQAAVRGTGPLAEFEENPLLKGMQKVQKGQKMPGWGNW